MTAPPLVTMHVWTIPTRHVPGSLWRMASQRRRIRNFPGVTFAKLLGTGSGTTFGVADVDVHNWCLLTVWDQPQAAAAFERSRVTRQWDASATERLRVEMRPLASKGTWSGQHPFGGPNATRLGDLSGDAPVGPVAAVTRARLHPRHALTFWRSVPTVAKALHRAPGLLLAMGIGEAPIGLQGTFSVWRSADELTDFAYRTHEHQRAIERTDEVGWYVEDLFARFEVLSLSGTHRGVHDLRPPPRLAARTKSESPGSVG